ncbi:hypothetical protein BH11BAC1_BH11BAC1_22890 [soil metagenome]
MRNFFLFFCILSLVAIYSCKRKYPESNPTDKIDKERLLDVSRSVVHDEAKAIEEFLSRHEWKMKMSGSGLRYEIYKAGNGANANGNSVLAIAYKVYQLDGTLCYEFDEAHPQHIVTGRGQQVKGLEEGLLMMSEGAHARFVVPDHLAYGLTGDQDKIPPASALYYDVHLIKIETPPNPK